jgi:hypothetical protein
MWSTALRWVGWRTASSTSSTTMPASRLAACGGCPDRCRPGFAARIHSARCAVFSRCTSHPDRASGIYPQAIWRLLRGLRPAIVHSSEYRCVWKQQVPAWVARCANACARRAWPRHRTTCKAKSVRHRRIRRLYASPLCSITLRCRET